MKIERRKFLAVTFLAPLLALVRKRNELPVGPWVRWWMPKGDSTTRMTCEVTSGSTMINQGACDDEILVFKSEDISWAPDQLVYPAHIFKRGFLDV